MKLQNRDNANLELVHLKDDMWQLKSDKEYVLRYIRMGIDEDGTIIFVDPAGGPFLSLNDTIENYKIVEFIDAITLRLNETNNNIS